MSYPTEREIETVFVSHVHDNMKRTAVIGRQVKLPMGILDLLLLHKHTRHESVDAYTVTVVEFKKDLVDADAVTQLLGYTEQIKYLAMEYLSRKYDLGSPITDTAYRRVRVQGWLIGRAMSKRAARVIRSSYRVSFLPYKVGPNGLITFNTETLALSRHTLQPYMKNYRAPKALSVAFEAIERTLRWELKEDSRWDRQCYEIDQWITKGVDHCNNDPDSSIEIWARDNEEHEKELGY